MNANTVHNNSNFNVEGSFTIKTSPVTVLEYYDKFKAWDMSTICTYMVDKGIYNQSEIDEIREEYCRYLSMVCSVKEKLPIASKIDPFWHTHIIFTQDYAAMCKAIRGRFIHHRPSILDGKDELDVAFINTTHPEYERNFGKVSEILWNEAVCGTCTGKDSCHAGDTRCSGCSSDDDGGDD